jgi:hypothetical protein
MSSTLVGRRNSHKREDTDKNEDMDKNVVFATFFSHARAKPRIAQDGL